MCENQTEKTDKPIGCLTRDDVIFLGRVSALRRQIARKVYECLIILCEISDSFCGLFDDDSASHIKELKECWTKWYASEIQPSGLREKQNEIEIGLARQILGILDGYTPECSVKVVGILCGSLMKESHEKTQERRGEQEQ